ncbi:hypothetical protein PDESU_01933 [Pontiella desulfatans]|uniref:Uncharacterized protein n=1 Tax=Pontiella desulfatans TaxID=2750659 RepID=A0A6C2U1W4_PONDE|nr:hypothetical protein [Pontiella desulfatans]VGO13376.1 hypothetical protein PDESU_01933 [Pontiella desulfatans]
MSNRTDTEIILREWARESDIYPDIEASLKKSLRKYHDPEFMKDTALWDEFIGEIATDAANAKLALDYILNKDGEVAVMRGQRKLITTIKRNLKKVKPETAEYLWVPVCKYLESMEPKVDKYSSSELPSFDPEKLNNREELHAQLVASCDWWLRVFPIKTSDEKEILLTFIKGLAPSIHQYTNLRPSKSKKSTTDEVSRYSRFCNDVVQCAFAGEKYTLPQVVEWVVAAQKN